MTDPLGVTKMFTKAIDFHGRRPAARTGRSRFAALCVLLGLGFAFAGHAQAENVLEDVTYVAHPGGRVEVTLRFAEPVTNPQAFTTENPPRIALDLAGIRNGFSQRRVDISAGATSGVSAVEAAGRTRVVVDLFRPASYETRIEGRNLVLAIAASLGGSTPTTSAAGAGDPTKAIGARSVELTGVDFRRGKAGEGRIVVNFSAPGAAADLRREGDRVVLDILNVKLPPQQAKRLDVLDFATPVQFVETRTRGSGVRLEITAQPPFEQLAFQTGSEYVVEIAPKREDDKTKSKNAEPVFSGSRVTFNFQDIPTRSVLQLIADVSDLNIVVADTVQGNVTLRLINVPWDQALHIVLQAKGLDQRRQGNVIWVAPQKEIADREQAMADARLQMEDKVELITDYIPISYGNAKDIAALLTQETKGNQQAGAGGQSSGQRGFLSQRGTVSYDDRTNTLLVSDTPQKILEIRELISVLDRPVQQVLIESRIVIATDTFARELGVRFGLSGGYEDNHGNVVSTAGSASGTDRMSNLALANRFGGGRGLPVFRPGTVPTSSTATGGGVAVPNINDRLNVNLPAATPAGSFGLAILGADYLLDLELSAAQTEGRGEVISSPRVVTANQREAVIKQGQEIGYVTFQGGAGGAGTATVQFKEAVLELKVTPTITADDRVVLNLAVKKDAIAGFIDNPGGGQVPQLDKREINTSVLVDNGQTVVLGGVYEVEKRDDLTKVPFLGDVPVLGNLFKRTGRRDTKAELLIFVTPRILSESLK